MIIKTHSRYLLLSAAPLGTARLLSNPLRTGGETFWVTNPPHWPSAQVRKRKSLPFKPGGARRRTRREGGSGRAGESQVRAPTSTPTAPNGMRRAAWPATSPESLAASVRLDTQTGARSAVQKDHEAAFPAHVQKRAASLVGSIVQAQAQLPRLMQGALQSKPQDSIAVRRRTEGMWL
jgi:hypothetical protein